MHIENPILKKVIVAEELNKLEYLVEDVFDQSSLVMTIPAKLRMNYFVIKPGECLYMIVPEASSERGVFIYEKYINLGNQLNDLGRQKMLLLEREKNLKK
ncbi:MAG: hypothetical protein ACRBG0_02880 [Lewinella sp.]|uniref:hypothetical protein n=1 Tax=Lewinella sp. TaxID=2004506 RepID=UPI003D6BE53B